MVNVFISYTSKDPAASVLARTLHDRLEEIGIEAFLDLSRIAPGMEIDAAIRQMLPRVGALLMVVSPSAEDSKWMMAECMYAFEHDIQVIPVLAESGIGVPFPFNRLRRLDFADRFDDEWPSLVELLGVPDAPAARAAPKPDPEPPRAGSARHGLSTPSISWILGAVVMIGLVAAGTWILFNLGTTGSDNGPTADDLAEPADTAKPQTPRDLTPADPAIDPQPARAPAPHPFPKLVKIPAGDFMMGSMDGDPDERPVHRVQIAGQFYLGATEVTFAQFDAFAQATDRALPEDRGGWGRESRPVINVTWQDARDYADWMSGQTDAFCRLPSEAEWEYAARAGTTGRFALPAPDGGDQLAGLANCGECSGQWAGESTAPVAQFAANRWGLHDMHGNVLEWVQDCWHANYESAPVDGRAWLDGNGGNCDRRVLRGGAWSRSQDLARSAYRSRLSPDDRFDDVGFRVLCSSPID